jgi:hypothetical protein
MSANPGEDQPVVASGGPNHITVQVSDTPGYPPKSFSLTPIDPAVPFKEIVITDGAKEVFRWALSEDWKITIV